VDEATKTLRYKRRILKFYQAYKTNRMPKREAISELEKVGKEYYTKEIQECIEEVLKRINRA
jgi:hypothetical protein